MTKDHLLLSGSVFPELTQGCAKDFESKIDLSINRLRGMSNIEHRISNVEIYNGMAVIRAEAEPTEYFDIRHSVFDIRHSA